MRHCRSCGVGIDDRPKTHFLCLRCYGQAARELRTGRERLSPTCAGIGITPDRLDQIARLLDQPNAREAGEVIAWIKTAKQILTAGGDQTNG